MPPVARTSNVIVQEVGTDLVVYDELTDRAHSLNPVAAYVYRHADGTRDLAALASAASTELGIPNDVAIVEEALARLESVELVTGAPPASPGATMARREALRRLGLVAAAAVPAVTSLAAPTPLLARSRGGKKGGGSKNKPKNGNGGNGGNRGNSGNNRP